MNMSLLDIAERLFHEFPGVSTSTVARVLADCEHRYPDTDRMFIEQAARAELRAAAGEP